MGLYTFNCGCVPFKGSFKGGCTMDCVKDNRSPAQTIGGCWGQT